MPATGVLVPSGFPPHLVSSPPGFKHGKKNPKLLSLGPAASSVSPPVACREGSRGSGIPSTTVLVFPQRSALSQSGACPGEPEWLDYSRGCS